MNNNTIRQLLERYFAGETTLQEEQQLKNYFQKADIAPDLRQYQPLFHFFQVEKEQRTSSQFEKKLQRPPISKPFLRKRLIYQWSVAATIAILVAVGGFWLSQQSIPPTQTASIDWSQYEPASDTEALNVTKKAFSRTSRVIQQSMATASGEIDNIQQVLQPFNKR